ncbi:Hypothetical_protein [Hexamita inflata]|uniref:Hypothetical_protein n=1 Tax=Hexamita inflata TaxID=28002 RepID=A0AA86NNF5_9EUKA|nr:Hypothetical protein HINF_LOCUS10252 [Hexamita inflata]
MTLHQFPSRARLSASSRRDRRRTERKVRANGAQAQAEARKAGGRRAKRAQSEGEQCKSKARRLQLGEQGSSSAKVRARAPDSRRNQLQADPARSPGKQGQPSSSQKSRRKTLTAKAGGEKGQNNHERRNQVKAVSRKGLSVLATRPLQVYKRLYSWYSLERQHTRVPSKPKTPTWPVQLTQEEVFYFAPFLQPRPGPVQQGARLHGQGGSSSATKAVQRCLCEPERLTSAASHARRPRQHHSEAQGGPRQRQLGPEDRQRDPDRARTQLSRQKASKADQQDTCYSVQAPQALKEAPTIIPRTRPKQTKVTPNDPETGLGAIIWPLALPEPTPRTPKTRPTTDSLPEAGAVPEFGAKFGPNSVWIHSAKTPGSGDGVLTHTVPVLTQFTHSPLQPLLVCLIEVPKNEVAVGRCWKISKVTHTTASM